MDSTGLRWTDCKFSTNLAESSQSGGVRSSPPDSNRTMWGREKYCNNHLVRATHTPMTRRRKPALAELTYRCCCSGFRGHACERIRYQLYPTTSESNYPTDKLAKNVPGNRASIRLNALIQHLGSTRPPCPLSSIGVPLFSK